MFKRQYSTESQQSANYIHSNSIKEKEATKSNNTGEKLIEVEKAETGSVSCIRYYLQKQYTLERFSNFYEKKGLYLHIFLFTR